MLRPRLLSFNVDGSGPQELPLDIAAIPVDAVAVLDSWYTVIVHTGSHLASWVKQVCSTCLWKLQGTVLGRSCTIERVKGRVPFPANVAVNHPVINSCPR